MSNPFVVIGGAAAGLSAASKCKREDPNREVIVFERGEWVSYAHCGMPYYVKGEVENLTDLLTLRPADVAERGVDLRRNHEVVGINTRAGTVTVTHDDEAFDHRYGDLLIATGARALTDPFEAEPLIGAFTIHSMDRSAALRAYLRDPEAIDPEAVDDVYVDRELVRSYAAMEPPSRAVIVGGGYVGVEMAEALKAHDLSVTMVQRSPRLVPPFGAAVGDAVTNHLRNQGVTVECDTEVDRILGDDRVTGVAFAGGDRLDADLVVIGVGVRPNAELVNETQIERGEAGAIATDDFGRTSVDGVYAAGDCAEARHAVTDDATWVPLGLTANRAGRAIGTTVAGTPTPVGPVAETAVLKAFELGAGRTGIVDPARGRAAGFDPVIETITAPSRSGYYPGADDTTVTLSVDASSGRVLGASTVGRDRAAKRIDPVAMALGAGLTVHELERQDLGYAPPFSPVWDPVLVAAKVVGGRVDPGAE